MFFWILIILLLNGIISFSVAVTGAVDTTTLWGMLSVTFVYFLGITQVGVAFSAIMRLSKAEWGRYFARLGEILTLSFIPVTIIVLIIIYLGGVDHIFYWASASHSGGHGDQHISPWLTKGLFLWRYIISFTIFYVLSYFYFKIGRIEEDGTSVRYDLDKRLNTMAGFVLVFYVVANTNVAWDFGMMIIKHWESTIFPAYFWVGSLFAGFAFLLLISRIFIAAEEKVEIDNIHRNQMAVLLLGFTLLWIYMFWSQHIVIWYGDLPFKTEPLFKTMSGNYFSVFMLMMFLLFAIPFFALIFRRIKLSVNSLSIIAGIICVGVWLNRYLMIIPVFSDGSETVFASWTGIALILAGLSATLLSIVGFRILFPGIKIKADLPYFNY